MKHGKPMRMYRGSVDMAGFLPIIVFVVIIVVGLRLMGIGGKKSTSKKAKTQQAQSSQPVQRDVVRDERIHTSWGYTFPADYEFYPDDAKDASQLLAHWKNLLPAYFKDCKIYYQVPASALDPTAHPASIPIPFLLETVDKKQLAVFIVRANNYRGINVMATKDICYDKGIAWIQFYEEYANDDDYVVARIRHYLEHWL